MCQLSGCTLLVQLVLSPYGDTPKASTFTFSSGPHSSSLGVLFVGRSLGGKTHSTEFCHLHVPGAEPVGWSLSCQ